MQTHVERLDPDQPDPAVIDRAAAVLRAGGLVAFPTETVYGLGAHALDPQAAARIFAAKGRPARNPLIVHVATVDMARRLARRWTPLAEHLAARFWPGPLTLVVEKTADVPDVVTAGGPTVGLRLPAHPVARALLAAAQVPIAAPSANRSNRISPTTADHVARQLAGRIELLLDAGPTSGGLESTVVDVTGPVPRVLRPGPITAEQVADCLSALGGTALSSFGDDPAHAVLAEGPHPDEPPDPSPAASAAPLRAPGQLPRHYAPLVPLELAAAADVLARLARLAESGTRIGWLDYGQRRDPAPAVMRIELPEDPRGYARRLYAALHELEAADVGRIVVTLPPSGPAWRAVHDRLRRAAATEPPPE
jgi:L-threonylcarbamoyladenylate synthase